MNNLDLETITNVAALLIHAAKIDEIYSNDEKKLIKNFIQSYTKDSDTNAIFKKAEQIETNSNQLLNFTNSIKKKDEEVKSNIIEHLWKVLISDNTIDQYESNLMRRICGLIYFSDKESGEIRMRLSKNKWLTL